MSQSNDLNGNLFGYMNLIRKLETKKCQSHLVSFFSDYTGAELNMFDNRGCKLKIQLIFDVENSYKRDVRNILYKI